MYIDELNDKNSTYNSFNTVRVNKRKILTQNSLEVPRKFGLRSILVLSSLPLFGIYTAFGIAPHTVTTNIRTSAIIEEVNIPQVASLTDSAIYHYSEHVRRDDTLNSVINRLNVSENQAQQFIKNNLLNDKTGQRLLPGQTLQSTIDGAGHLIALKYQFSDNERLEIHRTESSDFKSDFIQTTLPTTYTLKSATIENSLFASTDQANIPNEVAEKIIKIFEADIDFHKDLRKGDKLKVIYQEHYADGVFTKTGDVLAVEFINNQKLYQAVGYKNAKGVMEYFTPEGNSLNKSFLRSPLEFTRVTSGFSLGRFHPVLQRIRAHKGVDMAAPTGTRIRASGDAVVDFVGNKGGYGRVIILKHPDGIKTVYGHLSRFANIKVGQKINQGDIIGYVGKSGLATGPHLHYEFLVNGEHRDPMKVLLPKGHSIQASEKKQFLSQSQQLMAKIKLLDNTNIAALE